MSLINDALKRAKAAQRPTPAASRVDFQRSHEPAPAPRHNSPALLLTAVALAFVVGFLVIRLAVRYSTPANTSPQITPIAVQSPPSAATSFPEVASAAPNTTPSAVIVTTASPSGSSPTDPVVVRAVANAQSPTSNTPPAEAAPAKPAVKLQAIFFNPTRPSAMINGRTVYVGGKLADGKVIGIDQESVTFIAAGQTNVLTLAQ